jgi:catechol 2,3-dioxygenase-like lactoylglutathione lyase family enzyme
LNLQAIDHAALSVRDVERSAQWYVDVLGFERQHGEVWGNYPVFVGKNDAAIALFPIRDKKASPPSDGAASPRRVSPSADVATSPPPVRILHLAFRADRKGFVQAQKELKTRGIDFEFHDHKISHSIYFNDPDGHELEITTYELGG